MLILNIALISAKPPAPATSFSLPLATLDVIRASLQGNVADRAAERPDDLWRANVSAPPPARRWRSTR